MFAVLRLAIFDGVKPSYPAVLIDSSFKRELSQGCPHAPFPAKLAIAEKFCMDAEYSVSVLIELKKSDKEATCNAICAGH